MKAFRVTKLSLLAPDGTYSIQVSERDVTKIVFTSEGGAYTAVEAVLLQLSTLTDIEVDDLDTGVSTATVTFSGLVRGETYELAVTFTYADGTTETGTLFIECVS